MGSRIELSWDPAGDDSIVRHGQGVINLLLYILHVSLTDRLLRAEVDPVHSLSNQIPYRMVVRLRLARHGTKNNPFYHIVAIRDKAARDARPIEKLGEYDPIPRVRTNQTKPPSSPADLNAGQVTTSGLENFQKQSKPEKRVEWNTQRIHYWLGVGAQPSKPVAKLLDRVRECKVVKDISDFY